MANPVARWAGGNVSTRMACSLGASPPPAMPWSTRKAISHGSDGARPHSTLLSVNRATQPM